MDDPPDLDDDALLFLRQVEVRAPLQNIFNEIIECHTMMILHFQEHGSCEIIL